MAALIHSDNMVQGNFLLANFSAFRSLTSNNSRLINNKLLIMDQRMPSSSFSEFKKKLDLANHVVALTGAGISAESGIPTFRGAGGYWRKYESQSLATMQAFKRNPSLVWEFYSYRRELVLTKQPNEAHRALVKFEELCKEQGKKFAVITQNVDELHHTAGTKNLIELHGSLFKTKCMSCGTVESNRESPICEALRGKGAPDENAKDASIPTEELPRCRIEACRGLLRPLVVWFGENLDSGVLHETQKNLDECNLCLVVGTSSVVYPAAMFAPQLAARGVPVAEFNLESTPETSRFGFHFEGPCGTMLPKALGV